MYVEQVFHCKGNPTVQLELTIFSTESLALKQNHELINFDSEQNFSFLQVQKAKSPLK